MRRAFGALLIAVVSLGAAGQNRERQTYELIYQDVQLLKQQYQKLEKKVDAASDDIKAIRELVRDLAGQFKLFQADQARAQENLKGLPSQYQIVLERLSQIEARLLQMGEDLIALKAKPAPPVEPPQETAKKDDKTPAVKKPAKEPAKKTEPVSEKKEEKPAPVQTNLSPQEVYNTAYTDYQKGSYELSVAGFETYREQFPASPLADNALYMIGECYFSQKKFDKAIGQFDDLIVTYPLSDKVAAAYWKKGLSLVELKRKDEAVATLTLLMSKYPLEEEAKSAQQKIKELKEIK
jgi:tol-pal system protein YbgF